MSLFQAGNKNDLVVQSLHVRMEMRHSSRLDRIDQLCRPRPRRGWGTSRKETVLLHNHTPRSCYPFPKWMAPIPAEPRLAWKPSPQVTLLQWHHIGCPVAAMLRGTPPSQRHLGWISVVLHKPSPKPADPHACKPRPHRRLLRGGFRSDETWGSRPRASVKCKTELATNGILWTLWVS